MSFANPTQLRIGMNGNFSGKDYRLVGRVVMGETEDGETYYWNEFNLESKDGGYADLVYEETEHGGEWRLFTMFEPEYPMTAADAATKRVGDHINLTGEDVHVTLRSSSRVYHIEGKAPEGVDVGDVANYFNAKAGNDMQVVSWTGEEVEYYNGVNVSQSLVAGAFHLPRASDAARLGGTENSSWLGSNEEHYDSGAKFFLKFAVLLFVFIIVFGRHFSCSTDYESSPVKKIPAGPPPLAIGATGKVLDVNYHVTAHAVVDIAEMNARFERHEYQLSDDNGQTRLLVCGLKPDDPNWSLFESQLVLPAPRPQDCATNKVGDQVSFNGVTGTVHELFLSTTRQVEGPAPPDWLAGDQRFGYEVLAEHSPLLVRWNSAAVGIQRGVNLTAKEILAAFAATNRP
jgi:hypothetical protein